MRIDLRVEPLAKPMRCTVDGVDVSQWCYAADDVEGWAQGFWNPGAPTPTTSLRDEEGRLTVRYEGRVLLEPLEG